MRSFIDWYVKKYWGKDYIHKDEIARALLEAKYNEKERLKEIFGREKEALIAQKDMDKLISVQELKSEITQLKFEAEDMEYNVRKAQEVYYRTLTRTKNNASVILDMVQQSNNLRNMISTIFGALEGIQTRANRYKQEIEENEAADRIKLGLGI